MFKHHHVLDSFIYGLDLGIKAESLQINENFACAIKQAIKGYISDF